MINHHHLLDALFCVYDLGVCEQITPVHNGRNWLYRLQCRSGKTLRLFALKIYRANGEHALAGKQMEKTVLDRLYPLFPHVPTLVSPVNEHEGLECHPWGVVLDGGTPASLYTWVPTTPYRATADQLRNVGKRYQQLRRALACIDMAEQYTNFTQSGMRLLEPVDEGLHLSDSVSFLNFTEYLKKIVSSHSHGAFIYDNILYLEAELETLKIFLGENKEILLRKNLALAHLELSPSNFGFGQNHSVKMIFDFDSLYCGLPMQDLAWLNATFCIDHRYGVDRYAEKLKVLMSSFDSAFPVTQSESELLLSFIRLAYLDSIYGKLRRASCGYDARMGFTREDILSLRWLQKNNSKLNSGVY